MGTQARIAVYAPTAGIAKDAFDAAFARIRELDNLLSDYKPDSELNRLRSARPGTMHKVSGDLIVILDHARRLSEDTDGAFDVTVGPLTHLWRKARNERRLPAPDEIETARRSTGFRNVTIDLESQSVALSTAGMQLDLGGIAKGYAADAAREVLRNVGIERALVAIGGDICLGDAPPEQRGWRIGIQSTDNVATLARTCVSTSGDTEQYVEIEGVRYSHILDPRTGIGLRHRAMVTVRAPEGMLADSLATALSVLPPEDRQKLLRKYPTAKLY